MITDQKSQLNGFSLNSRYAFPQRLFKKSKKEKQGIFN